MENPQHSRLGTISIGAKVKYCRNGNCKYPVPANLTKCPKCNGTNLGRETPSKLNYFRFYGFPEDIEQKLYKKYGERPTSIPFTFPGHPQNYIQIGRECYQGKSLHCKNTWEYDQASGLWADSGRADRRMKDGLSRQNIPCVPDECPYVIGGKDPYLDGREIKARQCGEHVTAYVWLYDSPGLELVRVKSGGIKTITNFTNEIRKLLGLMSGRWQPMRLELRIRFEHTKYPDPNSGQLRNTEVPVIYIHFPQSIGELIEKQSRGQLAAGEIFVTLPSTQPALPSGHQDNYDDLVDGSRALPAPEAAETRSLSTLKGRDKIAPVQAEPLIDDNTYEIFKGKFREAAHGDRNYAEKLKTIVRRMFAIEKGRRFDKLELVKAQRIIAFLDRVIHNNEYQVPPDNYELQEYKWAIKHPDEMFADEVIETFEKNWPDRAEEIRNESAKTTTDEKPGADRESGDETQADDSGA
jgi:hypothetical protein